MSRTASLGTLVQRPKAPTYLVKSIQKNVPKVSEVALVYPNSWIVPLSPLAHEMSRRTELWLRERGVIHDEESSEKFRKLAVAEYANWPFPQAEAARAEVITKFLALWIFYDDVIEEKDDGQRAKIFQAIAGRPETCPEGNAHLRCWWELGRTYAQVMSPEWLERHARRFADWVTSVREECLGANQFRNSGTFPSAAKHLERRSFNIGMIPNIDFLEYQMGWELPAEALEDPDMKSLVSLSAEVVAIINDIFGYTKDRELRWCNLVPSLAQEFQISLDEAFRWVADMHNARVRAIAQFEEKLIQKSKNQPKMTQWIQGLRHIMYGFARWHAMAPRYRSSHDLGDQKRMRIQIRSS